MQYVVEIYLPINKQASEWKWRFASKKQNTIPLDKTEKMPIASFIVVMKGIRNPKCSLNLGISKKMPRVKLSFYQTAQLLQQLRVSLLTGNPFKYTNKGKSLK
ncbi:hypothetical protein T07_8259 [Trichinella nelsoni]|uniref:Uncharacterized protein n=1 Tax=Trichinella nelsoni TaxID=6336 RepID=A0A0V0S7B3_9BILA|nr:hypothetical protein T07_8259 [Trichinella nelsoni]